MTSDQPTQDKPTPDADIIEVEVQSGEGPFSTADRLADTVSHGETVKVAAKPAIKHPDDYEIQSEIGRGGMGVVFIARQKSLNRLVALKMVLSAQFSSEAEIERFHIEAAAAGKLDHPGIVPVHEVGEYEGQHYYSMGYVEGQSLSQRMRDAKGPLGPRISAKLVSKIAAAMHYAHKKGIIHRDLKPSNILLDENDEPKITDFGLAKNMEFDSKLTMTGQIVGTPSYMPPEQATGIVKRIGPAADIYSLGAMLYEMLTGRPPFGAASVGETIRQVIVDEPAPPRVLNSSVPADLQTICMKCLEKEPAKRFETAGALQQELDRFLDGKPIQSRPVGRIERIWRWCRRNPIEAVLAAGLAIAVLFALIVLVVSNRIQRTQNEKLTVALDEADASFRQMLRAVNDLFTLVSEDRLLREPGMQPLRKELLQRALEYYQLLLQQRADDPSLRDELALAYFRVGFITEQLESPETALDSYRLAQTMLESLFDEEPENKERLLALGDTLNAMGTAFDKLQRTDDAVAAYELSIKYREQLVEFARDNHEYQRKLANARMNLGLAIRHRDEKAAMVQFDRAQELRVKLIESDPSNAAVQRDLARGHFNLMNIALESGDVETAERHVRHAIDGFQKLAAESSMDDRYSLSVCQRLDADLFRNRTDDFEQALPRYLAAFKTIDVLVRKNPSVTNYIAARAEMETSLGWAYSNLGNANEAVIRLRRAEQDLLPLVKKHPEVVRFLEGYVLAMQTMCDVYLEGNMPDKATKPATDLRDQLQAIVDKYPNNRDAKSFLEDADALVKEVADAQ